MLIFYFSSELNVYVYAVSNGVETSQVSNINEGKLFLSSETLLEVWAQDGDSPSGFFSGILFGSINYTIETIRSIRKFDISIMETTSYFEKKVNLLRVV